MKIEDFLSAKDVAIDVRASDKANLLKALAGRAAGAVDLPAEAISKAIEERDELGSTGIGGGVCIPHARFREIDKPFGLLARLAEPIDFEAIDGQPVDLVFLILLPARSQLEQLNALAAAARKLRDHSTLEKLRTATTGLELYAAISA
jgi:PTS system nitrogen regulatory IIA component